MSHGDSSQATMRLSYGQLRETLKRFAYFRHWTEDQVRRFPIRECSILARVVQYEPHQTIPLELPLPFTYLVLSGQCMILQCLQLVRESCRLATPDDPAGSPRPPTPDLLDPGAPDNQLEAVHHLHETFTAGAAHAAQSGYPQHDPDSAICFLKTPPPVEPLLHQFVDVGTLRCGAVFGLGERHQHRTIVARTRTQCLLIPRCWLFLKAQNIANTWQRLRMYLDGAVPDRDELYRRFMRDRAWLAYRRWLADETVARPVHTGTVLADVPMMCRILAPSKLNGQKGAGC
uniref:Cyclic nucleotide-binding domain-containing protein n=1 Tax=Anopheles epiroticus TaxID=199890 RepID=A0A182P7V4_9DIPT